MRRLGDEPLPQENPLAKLAGLYPAAFAMAAAANSRAGLALRAGGTAGVNAPGRGADQQSESAPQSSAGP